MKNREMKKGNTSLYRILNVKCRSEKLITGFNFLIPHFSFLILHFFTSIFDIQHSIFICFKRRMVDV